MKTRRASTCFCTACTISGTAARLTASIACRATRGNTAGESPLFRHCPTANVTALSAEVGRRARRRIDRDSRRLRQDPPARGDPVITSSFTDEKSLPDSRDNPLNAGIAPGSRMPLLARSSRSAVVTPGETWAASSVSTSPTSRPASRNPFEIVGPSGRQINPCTPQSRCPRPRSPRPDPAANPIGGCARQSIGTSAAPGSTSNSGSDC